MTKPGETEVVGAVTIMGPVNLPASLPFDSSQMYGRNLTNFLLHLADESGTLKLESDDEIIRATMATRRAATAKNGAPAGSLDQPDKK